jgi:Tachylectin
MNLVSGGSGRMFGVTPNGALNFYKYGGHGESDSSGASGFDPNSGNQIGNGFNNFTRLVSGGDGLFFGVHPNGDLLYFKYTGDGQSVPSGATGFAPNSGNHIGNGFNNFTSLVGGGDGVFFGVHSNGDLLYFKYTGDGQNVPSGATGFAPNSGNQIGNGFNNFTSLVGGGDGVFFGVHPNGDLLYFKYTGDGQSVPSGATGFAPNSGNQIGNGFNNFRLLVGEDDGVVFGVHPNGDLLYFKYIGDGQNVPSGATGFAANSGNQIGRGF